MTYNGLRYATARRYFEYLESLADLTDQVELDSEREELMRDPTKKRAGKMYEALIELWFGEHKDAFDEDPKVRRIRKRLWL